MNKLILASIGCGLALTSLVAYPKQPSATKPEVIAKSELTGMPTTATQEVRVLTATLAPGQRSVFHTHRSPVTTYILEGELTLETKGNDTAVYKTGDVFFEVPDVPTTAYNASASDTTKVLIFYVSDPGTPFMEPISQ